MSLLDLKDYISKPRDLSLEANKHWEKQVPDSDKPAFSVLPAPEPETEVNKFGNASTTNRTGPQPTQSLCYYHSTFGNKALKCPCSSLIRHSSSSKLFFIRDYLHIRKFMVDSGAELSVIPGSGEVCSTTTTQLTSTKGQPISTFGKRRIEFRFAGTTYTWEFIVAAVTKPLLGADFLHFHNLLL